MRLSISGGDTTKYRYGAGWDVLNEEDGSGTLLRTRFGGLAIAAGSSAATGTWAYYFTDALGSTRSLWDQDGDRIGKYEYTPFGGKYADSGNDVTRKYTGHDWDREARLYSTAYRFYSPDSNRWLTRDPLGMVDGPNVYAYVVNNPVTYSDPLGMFSLGNVMSGIRIGLEVLTSMSDIWAVVDVLNDPCATTTERNIIIGLAIAGILIPGGGGAGGMRTGARYADDVLDFVRSPAAKNYRETIARGASGSNRIQPGKMEALMAHGGRAKDWTKKIARDPNTGIEWHWYENEPAGLVRGIKQKGQVDPDEVQLDWVLDNLGLGGLF